jgi:hypothetical protein
MRPARLSYFLRRRGHDKSRNGSLVGGVHRRQPCRRLLEVVLAHDGAAKGVAELEACRVPSGSIGLACHGERIENPPQLESSPNGPHSLSLRRKTCNPLKIKNPTEL